MEREGLGGFELLVIVIAGIGLALVGAVWAGASLALAITGAGGSLPLTAAADAVLRLPANLSTPAEAWPEPYAEVLPGASLYWLCTVVAAAGIIGTSAFVIRWLTRSKVGTTKRRPMGVDGRTSFAKRRDLKPLLVSGPTPGRFVLARFGRRLVATESPPPRSRGWA